MLLLPFPKLTVPANHDRCGSDVRKVNLFSVTNTLTFSRILEVSIALTAKSILNNVVVFHSAFLEKWAVEPSKLYETYTHPFADNPRITPSFEAFRRSSNLCAHRTNKKHLWKYEPGSSMLRRWNHMENEATYVVPFLSTAGLVIKLPNILHSFKKSVDALLHRHLLFAPYV